MHGSKAKHLSSLFSSAVNKVSKTTGANSKSPILNNLENFTAFQTYSTTKRKNKLLKRSSRISVSAKSSSCLKKFGLGIGSDSVTLSSSSLQEGQKQSPEESATNIRKLISNILFVGGESDAVSGSSNLPDINVLNDDQSQEEKLDIPWFPSMSNSCVSHRMKVKSRGKKGKFVSEHTQNRRFEKLITMCGEKMGADATVAAFGKLGRAASLREYTSLIGFCVEKARESQNEEDSLDHIHKAYQLLSAMKEQSLQAEDKTYGPLLLYLIDMKMVEEFDFFCEVIKNTNSSVLPRLGYYEMLLWITVGNDDKVQELCNSVISDADTNEVHLAENYLLALCETDRKMEVLRFLEVFDITKISSLDNVASLFKTIGRLLLEEHAEKLIKALRTSEVQAKNVSFFISSYVICMPNLAVEDVISKFEDLHEKFDVGRSSISYDALIRHCCNSLKVHAAFALVEQMCEFNLALSIETFYPIIYAIEESCEFALVHPIYSAIRRHNLQPKSDVLKILINLHVKIKDFEGAYNILSNMKEMDRTPTAGMYNAILAGYLREKRINAGEMVLKQMKLADVEPDSRTFSYLISNSQKEEDVIKYFEEMKSAKVKATKHVYMALINAYVNCGKFDKAKQVILDREISHKIINEVKSVLVSALASSGQILDALQFYDEIKQDGCHLEPKAVINIIEHLQSGGHLDRLLQLLQEVKDPDFWFDGCERVVIYCVRHKHLSAAINLLKQLKDQDEMSTHAVLDKVFCEIFEINPPDLQVGLDLLQAVKEELKFRPSRTSLDFLFSACICAKDPFFARLILEEYEKAGLAYNVMTYIRIYQILLACGQRKDAKKVLKKIPKDDPHVISIIKACDSAFSNSKSLKDTPKGNLSLSGLKGFCRRF